MTSFVSNAKKIALALHAARESILVTLAFAAGVVAVPVGVGMVYLPAGFIVGGAIDLTFVLLYAKGRL